MKKTIVWIGTLFILWVIDCFIRTLNEGAYEIYKSLIVCAFFWFLTDKSVAWIFSDGKAKGNETH